MRQKIKFLIPLLLVTLGLTACKLPFLGSESEAEKEPEKVMEESWSKVDEIKSAKMDVQMGMEIEEEDGVNVNVNLQMAGAYDISDEENPLADFTTTARIDAGEEGSVTLNNLQFRIVDNKLYFSLGGLTSDVEDFAGVDELIGAFLNTWYMIDPEDPALKEYQDMIGADLPGDEADMNPEQIFAILEALSDTQIFSNVEYDKDEKIEGVDCSKMTFDGIDAEALWTVLMEMQRVFGADEITEADKAEFLEALEMIDLAGAIWIGKTDKYMCKMEVNFTVTEDDNVARVNLAVVLANINQAVNVNAPADAQNFLEAIEQMFAGMMGGFDDMDYDDYDWDDDFDWDDDYEWPDYDDMTEEEWLEFMNQ